MAGNAAMIENIDHNVGRVFDLLKQQAHLTDRYARGALLNQPTHASALSPPSTCPRP